MVLTCPKCEARLQIDETKIPASVFEVRCPKCQGAVSVPSGEASKSQPREASGGEPDMSFEPPPAAKLYNPRENERTSSGESPGGMAELAKLLSSLLPHPEVRPDAPPARPAWQRRKALVCASAGYREAIAESLSREAYDVFVAENLAQGLGRMREERMDIVIMDANFDPVEQGVAFMTREVRQLRPADRRRLFFVYVTSNVRTMDLHAAFLQNVNLVVNPTDIERLPEVLDLSIRHYNELYAPFNCALNVAAI